MTTWKPWRRVQFDDIVFTLGEQQAAKVLGVKRRNIRQWLPGYITPSKEAQA
jgi:hypothetical protein